MSAADCTFDSPCIDIDPVGSDSVCLQVQYSSSISKTSLNPYIAVGNSFCAAVNSEGTSSFQKSDMESESDSDDAYTDIETGENYRNIGNKLAELADIYRVALTAVAALLSMLKPYFSHLPRTLLKTPSDNVIKSLLSGGDSCHLGIAKGLCQMLESCDHVIHNAIQALELQFNVDGLPLCKSSNMQLSPILCRVKRMKMWKPFVVSLHCGMEKPGNVAQYLEAFILEANELVENGLLH